MEYLRWLTPLLVVGCVDADIDSEATGKSAAEIGNGNLADRGQFAATGALFYEGTFEGQPVAKVACTGTLIAPDVVLTAAHCLDPYLIDMVGLPTFSLAADTTARGTSWTTGARAVIHESYVSQEEFHIYLEDAYDIGLLFLSAPVPNANPAKIATPDLAVTVGLELEVVGYGQTTAVDELSVGVQRYAVSEVSELGASELRHVGSGTPDSCMLPGDSGGPSFATLGGETRLVGVSSHAGGETFCDGNGDIVERVDTYAAWIASNAPEVCDATPEACGGAGGSGGSGSDAGGAGGSVGSGGSGDPGEAEDDDDGCSAGHRANGAWWQNVALIAAAAALARRRARR